MRSDDLRRLPAAIPLAGNRMSDEFMQKVDARAADQADEPGRSEAVRRLVELGLKTKTKP
jgi:hypothetical protein